MPPWKHVTKRVLFAAFAMYLVVSVTFGLVALTEDPNEAQVAHKATEEASPGQEEEAVEEAISDYRERNNLDDPITERYVRWVVGIATLDWGYSSTQNAPVTDVIQRTLPATLAYVLPAMLVALVGGVGLGVFSAMNDGTVIERFSTGGLSLAYGVPNFWWALVIPMVAPRFVGDALSSIPEFQTIVLPAGILGTSLMAAQLRYARAESNEYVNREFVKLVRAKGASNVRVGRHVLRNAALPLFSLFFVELLGVLVVNVFVLEQILPIGGIGAVGLRAINDRDMALIIGVAIVTAFAGIVGSLVQDLAHLSLDPRVEAD
ncbi:ABC transporter permease [Halostella sp. PRR32]|uniref:ABC transporter permease n=1 Tax=Halostella sp. PRR32 TaxID=3098147 RepID=UPI002B1E4F53|nr:ABC transporter permease [Halostella sp. PRR32]